MQKGEVEVMVHPVIIEIKKSVTVKNQDKMIAFVGKRGSGKSYSAISLARELDPNFDVTQIALSNVEFMNIIDLFKNKSQGKVILFDEVGVGLSAQEWYEKTAKKIQQFMQVSRKYNFVVIFTVPTFKDVNSAVRKYFDVQFTMKKIDRLRKLSYATCKYLQTNEDTGKVYKKHWRDPYSGNKTGKIFRLPPRDLLRAYEDKKAAFADRVTTIARIQNEEANPFGELTAKQQLVHDLYTAKGLSQRSIGEELGIAAAVVSEHIKLIRKKGFRAERGVRDERGSK